MKRILWAVLIVATLSGCETGHTAVEARQPVKVRKEYPTVNLPMALREKNWLGQKGQGSCVHASMIMILRWQGRLKLADWWRTHHGDGEWEDNLMRKFNAAGVRFASTENKRDVTFLEWACRTRRGCGVTCMGGRHMVCLVHFDNKWAGILDNNRIEKIKWMPRETFLSEWFNSNSWAITPVYTPAPPLPQR